MKTKNKIFTVLIIACSIFTLFAISSFASNGNGYAMYRDGAFGVGGNVLWHGGLSSTTSNANGNHTLVHAMSVSSGSSLIKVESDTLSGFIKDENFKGFYYPKSGIPDSAGRNNVAAMGRILVTENIPYSATAQIDYKVVSGQTWLLPEDIKQIRCDGVVEYCFEYYGYKIFGSDSYWDITRMGSKYKSEHSGIIDINPKKQCEKYMTQWNPRVAGKTFNLINASSWKGLDVPNSSSANGTDLQQWAVTGGGGSNQRFKNVLISTDLYSFIPQHAIGSAVEVTNNANALNAFIQIWATPSSGYMNSQKFAISTNTDGSYRLLSMGSNYTKMVGATGTSNGNSIVLLTNDAGNKKGCWYFVPTT